MIGAIFVSGAHIRKHASNGAKQRITLSHTSLVPSTTNFADFFLSESSIYCTTWFRLLNNWIFSKIESLNAFSESQHLHTQTRITTTKWFQFLFIIISTDCTILCWNVIFRHLVYWCIQFNAGRMPFPSGFLLCASCTVCCSVVLEYWRKKKFPTFFDDSLFLYTEISVFSLHSLASTRVGLLFVLTHSVSVYRCPFPARCFFSLLFIVICRRSERIQSAQHPNRKKHYSIPN